MKIVVFGSGRGSNFKSIVQKIKEGVLPVEITAVVVNKPGAPMRWFAEEEGFNVIVVNSEGLSRDQHEQQVLSSLNGLHFDLVVLAGYMRILSSSFINQLGVPIINIHPSLLPAFKGLHAQRQALEYGVKYTGCTVHLVTPEVDSGKIIDQAVVKIQPGETVESLSSRILEKEHFLLPDVLRRIAVGEIILEKS